MKLETDSAEYELLADAVASTRHLKGIAIELGTRKGGSMQTIMDNLLPNDVVISIDPYGNILYNTGWAGRTRLDYTNSMRNEAMANLYAYAQQRQVNFLHFSLEDTEFFARFSDGVPVYDTEKLIINEYSVAFLDAGHTIEDIFEELCFFAVRMQQGAKVVVDDIGFIDVARLNELASGLDFAVHQQGGKKVVYVKL